MIKISHIEKSTELLGPYKRFVIWVHGCCFNCEGCLAVNNRSGKYTEITASALADMIIAENIEGITISGGEPFLQSEELCEAVRLVRVRKDIGVIIYSGFRLEELKEKPSAFGLLSETDLLIDGRYIKELDNGRPFIGSSNQKLIYLSDRYKKIGSEYYTLNGLRKAEIKLSPEQAVLIGVPSENVLNVWNEIKKKTGGNIYDF